MAGVNLCVEIHLSGPQFWLTESGLAGLEPSVFSEAPKYEPVSPLHVGRTGVMTSITY